MRRVFPLVLLAFALAGGWLAASLRAQEGGGLLDLYSPAMRADFVNDLASESAGRPFYDITVSLSVGEEAVTFTGAQTVRLTNTSPDTWDRLVLRLYPNAESFGGQMVVHQAAVNGQAVTPQADGTGTLLDVPLSDPLSSGEEATLDLAFETTLTPGPAGSYNQFTYLDGVLAAPEFYPVLSVYEPGRGWWRGMAPPEGDAVYSESAFYHVWLTAPDDLIVITSGTTVGQQAGDGTVTYEIVAPLMRDFVLMASEDFEQTSASVDGTHVRVYTYDDRTSPQAALDVATGSVRVFNQTFGPYPFSELDVVETPTSAGGIEYPGLIVIAHQVWQESTSLFFPITIAHEVGHQWWYSLVGNDQVNDPWLDESLTQYSVAVYFRLTHGAEAETGFLDYFYNIQQQIAGTAADLPIGLPVAAYTEGQDAYFNIIYAKGPLFFDALATIVGDETMLTLLRDYFAAFRYEVAEPLDMLNRFEATLGRDDLDGLFRNWVGDFPGLQ